MRTVRRPDGRLLASWELAPWGNGAATSRSSPMMAPSPQPRPEGSESGTPPGLTEHPLAEPALSAALNQRADEIGAAFAAIEPVLRQLAPRQFDEHFPARAHRELASSLGVDIPAADLEASWTTPLDLGRVHARCVLGTFCNLVEREFDRNFARLAEGESAEVLIRRFGFHAVDITSCSDGRLGGVVDYILRVPPAVVVWRDSYAGTMFDVEDTLHHWEQVELRRWREGWPNPADEPTRYLKIGVYHFSSVDPHNEGCAAHGSDDTRAAGALLARLQDFESAVEATHRSSAGVVTLLVGVDTDTDAIRVHVPDPAGAMTVTRFVSSATLYERTASCEREVAKDVIRDAVAQCAGVAADDPGTEGMRWLCGYLLKNNIGQVDALRHWNGGSYPDRGHTERLAVAGDGIDDVQLRNLAFQAQMRTLEEGATDLDVGIGILGRAHAPHGLDVPVLVHVAYDERIPGADASARQRARRLSAAIESRYARPAGAVGVAIEAVVRARGSPHLEHVALQPDEPPRSATPEIHPKEYHG